jgi:hypothetical protein
MRYYGLINELCIKKYTPSYLISLDTWVKCSFKHIQNPRNVILIAIKEVYTKLFFQPRKDNNTINGEIDEDETYGVLSRMVDVTSCLEIGI